MERENRPRGSFVAFGSTSDAEQEAAAFYKRTNRWIKLITVQEILDFGARAADVSGPGRVRGGRGDSSCGHKRS